MSRAVPDQEDIPGSLPTHRADYPGVAEWLRGARHGHWWVRLLDTERDPAVTPPTVADMVLGPLESLVQAVRAASPAGLGQFVGSRFRDADSANLLSARLELLCAAGLAIRRIPFDFGGKAEPDLTWNPGTEAQGWMEIHRGAFDVFGNFQQSLNSELAAKGAVLTVRLDQWPLEVPDRNLVHSRISGAIDAAVAANEPKAVPLGELGDGATGVVEVRDETIGIGRVFVQHPGITPSGRYLDSVASRLARKVNVDKAGQARKGQWDADRTVLLIDISTARLAQLLGQDGLAAWLEEVPIEWEDLPFAAVAVCFTNLQGPFLWGSSRYRPGMNPADRARLDPLLAALGLPCTRQTR
jgi:hypothetical protein